MLFVDRERKLCDVLLLQSYTSCMLRMHARMHVCTHVRSFLYRTM